MPKLTREDFDVTGDLPMRFPIPTLASIRRQLDREALIPPCPNEDVHTRAPKGYLARHDWAEEMTRTHRQVRCEGCGLLAIWVPRAGVSPQRAAAARRVLATRFGLGRKA